MSESNGGIRAARERAGLVRRVLSEIQARAGLAQRLGQTYSGDRDLYATMGYRTDPQFDDFLSYYLRGDIAAKIVDLAPKTTWRHSPEIRSDNEAFVEAVKQLNKSVRLFHSMQRVDEIGGIGQYGVLVIGTRGGMITEEPMASSVEDVVYLSAYHQGSVEIVDWVNDSMDPRYGLPAAYEIEIGGTTIGETERDTEQLRIPWQRCIHVAENTVEDNVFGQPRLARVLNRIDDFNKVLGASAELYWQNVGGVWHADIDPNVQVDSDQMSAFEDNILEARHGITRLIQTRGVDLNTVVGGPIDPRGSYEALKEVLSAGAEIPQRVLFGSERGQLAGNQDQKEWQARIAARQEQHAEPNILRPTLNRLIAIGALPEADYDVEWPPLDAPSTEDRAEVAKNFADAIAKLAPGGAADLIMPPWEVRTEILGLDAVPAEIPDGYEFADEDVSDADEFVQPPEEEAV